MSFSFLYLPLIYSKSWSVGAVNFITAPPGLFTIELIITLPGGIPSEPYASWLSSLQDVNTKSIKHI